MLVDAGKKKYFLFTQTVPAQMNYYQKQLADIFPAGSNAFSFPNRALVDANAVANRALKIPPELVDEFDPFSDNYMDGVRGKSIEHVPLVYADASGAPKKKILRAPGSLLAKLWKLS